ncbi:MAG: methyl-accepting chemotaxis protein, partial [Roseobacter sp.]
LISTSEQQVQQGVALVDQTGAALSEIVISVSEISQRVSSIAGSTREQSVGLNEINVAVNDLDHVTQQNAAMFEETTAASHALMSETDALAKAVSRFKLGSSGAAKRAAQDPEIDGKITAVPAVCGNLALQSDDSSQAQTGWEDF